MAPLHQRNLRIEGASQNTASAGLDLANRVVSTMRDGFVVSLDLKNVERLTPSFANALVMTIIEAVGEAAFRTRLTVVFGSDIVQDSWRKAAQRYERGVRLTTQRDGSEHVAAPASVPRSL